MKDMLTKLEEWPRTPFVREPTPLIQAPNLAQLLGRAPEDVLLKMDAESGFGLGGNKARKLEFELAPARPDGSDPCDYLRRAPVQSRPADGGGGGTPRVEVRVGG